MIKPTKKATRNEYTSKVFSFLKKHKYNNDSVLENSGNTVEWLQFFKRKTLTSFPKIDAHDLPYQNNSFDCVIANQVLEHVKKPWVCVKEFHRVLKKKRHSYFSFSLFLPRARPFRVLLDVYCISTVNVM